MSVLALAERLGLHRAGRAWRGDCPGGTFTLLVGRAPERADDGGSA
jgi:hypothetical protein